MFRPICGPSSGCDITFQGPLHKMCGVWGLGGWGRRDLVVLIAGIMTWAITSGLSLVFCVHSINLVFNNRDEVCLLRGTN